jgi:hypothetical protein
MMTVSSSAPLLRTDRLYYLRPTDHKRHAWAGSPGAHQMSIAHSELPLCGLPLSLSPSPVDRYPNSPSPPRRLQPSATPIGGEGESRR